MNPIAKWIGAHPNNFEKGGNKPNRIILHHIVGPQSAADGVFKSPYGNGKASRPNPASATYSVGPAIHQYVKETDIAYAQGYAANRYAISIEHAGPPYAASTYANSAKLVADICKRYKWTVDYALRLPRHSDYASTACPGKLDIAKIKKDAYALLKGGNIVIETSRPVFRPDYYLKMNPDVAKVRNTHAFAQEHWLRHGIKEGRRSAPNLHVKEYLANYGDLRKAYGEKGYAQAIKHYYNHGINEGRLGRTKPTATDKIAELKDKIINYVKGA